MLRAVDVRIGSTGGRARLLGVQHGTHPNTCAASEVLNAQPRAVCVETPPTPTRTDRLQSLTFDSVLRPSSDGLLALYKRCSNAVALSTDQSSELSSLASSGIPSEQLVYIAALAIGAPVVNADRPKRATYLRLLRSHSLEQLDNAFSAQADRFAASCAGVGVPHSAVKLDAFEETCMRERDILMASSIATTASSFAHGSDSDSVHVVAVVGNDHVDNLTQLLEHECDSSGTGLQASSESLLEEPQDPPRKTELPLRRAITEAVLNLRAPSSVIREAIAIMDQLREGEHDIEQYLRAKEAYCTGRMLLESLSLGVREHFFKPTDSFEPLLQHCRPINGGSGPSDEDILSLREHVNLTEHPWCLQPPHDDGGSVGDSDADAASAAAAA